MGCVQNCDIEFKHRCSAYMEHVKSSLEQTAKTLQSLGYDPTFVQTDEFDKRIDLKSYDLQVKTFEKLKNS